MATDEPPVDTPGAGDDAVDPADPLDPATEARVRHLLADARVTEPVPAEVAARLDATLADLVATRAVTPGQPGVVDLAARRRRRRAAALLGAAAAVTVFGFGFNAVVSDTGSDDAATGGEVLDEDVQRGVEPEVAASPTEDYGQADADASEADPGDVTRDEDFDTVEDGTILIDGPAPRIRPGRLVDDLVAVRDSVLPASASTDYDRTLVAAPEGFMCDEADWGPGILVAVRYDGDPAIAAFREPVGDTQVVEVLQCGTGDALRSVTVPAEE